MATSTDRTSALGRRVRAERERQGMTRARLALASDMTEANLARIELYGQVPSVATVVAIAAALGVSVDWLLLDEPSDGEAAEAREASA